MGNSADNADGEAPAVATPIDDPARERMLERLREHVGTGWLTLAEFEDRATTALSARTGAELELATHGLPVAAVAESRRPEPRRWIVGVFGGSSTKGRWRVASRLRAVAVFGGSDIDLRSAEFDGDEIVIDSVSLFGGNDVYLPAGVDAELTGGALFGGNDVSGATHPPRPGAPVVRVRALSLFGGTDVHLLPPEASALPLREARRLAKGAG